MAYTPAQLSRVRDELLAAGHADPSSLSDEAAVSEYLKVAQPDDFTKQLQDAGGNAPGFEPNNVQDAGKEMYNWASSFKTRKGRAPSRQDFVEAWGELGGQMVDWVVSTGSWPDEATFTQRAGQAGLTTPPGGSIGSTYAPQTSIDKQRFDWQKDLDERQFAANEAKRKADEARAAGDSARADAYLKIAQDAQAQADAIQVAGLTGTYNGAPTLAADQFNRNFGEGQRQFDVTTQQAQDQIAYGAARAGNPLQYLQATRGIGAPVQQYAGMPQANGTVAPGYTPGAPTRNAGPAMGPVEVNQSTVAPGYQAPQMPGNISSVLSGAPLPAYGIGQQGQNNAPGNPYQLRAAGAQAQSNEGSLGQQSRYEAMELAGVRGEDLADQESRIRKNLGGGLAPASYR